MKIYDPITDRLFQMTDEKVKILKLNFTKIFLPANRLVITRNAYPGSYVVDKKLQLDIYG